MQPIKRPSIRRSSQKSQQHSHHHSPIEIQPDYTEDENEDHCNSSAKNVAFSYYPSGSMTLPHPKKSSQKATEKSAEKGGAETAAAQNTESVASNSSSPTKKSLNESGESDPGYESDSSKSKSNSGQALLMTEPKATTLPRRSATVQKNSALQHTLDRRKLRGQAEELELEEPSSQSSASKTGTESEAGLTVEIISPVRVPITSYLLFHIGLLGLIDQKEGLLLLSAFLLREWSINLEGQGTRKHHPVYLKFFVSKVQPK